jgi:hypothetical protein
MVHRTDITGLSMGQASPGHDGVRRPALNDALLENNFSLSRQESAAVSSRRRCRRSYLELLTL